MSYESDIDKTMWAAFVAKIFATVFVLGSVPAAIFGDRMDGTLVLMMGIMLACAGMITSAIGRAHKAMDEDMGIVIKKMSQGVKP